MALRHNNAMGFKVTENNSYYSGLIRCQHILEEHQMHIIEAAGKSDNNMHLLYYHCSLLPLVYSRLFTTCGHLSLNMELLENKNKK